MKLITYQTRKIKKAVSVEIVRIYRMYKKDGEKLFFNYAINKTDFILSNFRSVFVDLYYCQTIKEIAEALEVPYSGKRIIKKNHCH